MINDKISPLQLTRLRKLPTGMTEMNHLSQFYETQPEKMDGILAFAFGTENKSVLSMLTGGLGNTKYIKNREYEWMLHGQNERRVSISRNHLGGGTSPGVGGSYFKIYFDEKLFARTELIVSANGTQLYVSDDPYQDGTDWVYTVQLYDPNLTFCDPVQVDLGGSFSKDFAPVEEFSDQGGQTYFSAPLKFTNQLTTLRKEYSCTRDAALAYMVMELYAPNGKKTSMWTELQEWTALQQFQKEIDNSFMFSLYNGAGTPNGPMKGKNGRPVFTGAGIRQQISPANIRYYSRLTYQILNDFLDDLAYVADKNGGETNFVALTGLQGMKEFDRAISEYARGNNITVTDSGTFIRQNGDKDDLELKGHYKKVTFINGRSLTVKRFAPYDDEVRFGANLHPVTKKPIESYRFTILDFGSTAEGKANIQKVALEQSDSAMWHVAGSIDPMRAVAKSTKTLRASAADGYKVFMLSSCGVQMQNPLAAGELIFDYQG